MKFRFMTDNGPLVVKRLLVLKKYGNVEECTLITPIIISSVGI